MPSFHVVFTLPAAIADIAYQNKAIIYDLLFKVSAVTVHMTFTGHFTGKLGETQGKGQPIAFIATDLVKVEVGRITDNWHIEDNLTLLQQMGVATVAP